MRSALFLFHFADFQYFLSDLSQSFFHTLLFLIFILWRFRYILFFKDMIEIR